MNIFYKMQTETFTFPYYQDLLPEEGSNILGRVIEHQETGVLVYLPEYQGREFIINYRDANKSARIRNIRENLKKGHEYIFLVQEISQPNDALVLNRLDLVSDDDKKYQAQLKPYLAILALMNSLFIKNQIITLDEKKTILNQTVWQYGHPINNQDWRLNDIFSEIAIKKTKCSEAFPILNPQYVTDLEQLIINNYRGVERAQAEIVFKVLSYEIEGAQCISNFLIRLEPFIGAKITLKSTPDYRYSITLDDGHLEHREALENKVKSLFGGSVIALAEEFQVLTRLDKILWQGKG